MSMTEYTIINDGRYAFGVEGTAPSRFLSVRGFPTELDAAAWIAGQQVSERGQLERALGQAIAEASR